jgi:multicomponent Na+:H+ antiporter subunit F
MKFVRWSIGAVFWAAVLVLIATGAPAFPFFPGSQYARIVGLALYLLVLGAAMCLYRVFRGPTAADRIVAIDIFGILIVGFCAVAAVATDRDWYLDIGIAWALQSFIGSLALAKYLEGRSFDA